MKVLQVKQYNNLIAKPKEQKALERWRAKKDGYGYPVESMFYFMRVDRNGYPSTLRKNGYVAFNDTCAVFGRTEQEARAEFDK